MRSVSSHIAARDRMRDIPRRSLMSMYGLAQRWSQQFVQHVHRAPVSAPRLHPYRSRSCSTSQRMPRLSLLETFLFLNYSSPLLFEPFLTSSLPVVIAGIPACRSACVPTSANLVQRRPCSL